MNAERSAVRWGNTEIPYVIRRSDRRGTVAVAVETSGEVVLTAPPTTPVTRLDDVVRAKAKWIVDRVRRRSDLPPPPPREFVSGETFRYLGRQYRLRVLPGQAVRPVTLRGGHLELPVPEDLDEESRAAYARAALIDWYKHRAREQVPGWLAPWVRAMRVEAPELLVTDQEKRWGSCSRGTLRINWRIVQAPKPIVDYVLAHEVVHLVYPHHGAQFWSAVAQVMPAYEVTKARLAALGPELTW